MRTLFATLALAGFSMCGTAGAQECSQTIEGNDQIQFNVAEIRVSASCGEVTITLRHTGQLPATAMGHNWVLAATPDFNAVAQAGAAAGAPNYVPQGDARVLAASAIIGGGEETSVTFDISGLTAGGDYTYFCSFPGHYVLMNGKFIIE
jgi:azurin